MDVDLLMAISTVMLASITLVGVGAAIYAGFYAKKAYEVAQSQRQIENAFRFGETLDNILKNTMISLPSLGELSCHEYLLYHQAHPEEFEMSQSGWPIKKGENLPSHNITFKRTLELFNMFAYSALEGAADLRILYFRHGQYMQFIFNEMSRTKEGQKHLAKYHYFTQVLKICTEQLTDLPIRDYFGLNMEPF